MAIERIEVFVTELPARLQRTFSSGSWDTGPAGQILGKPVLVKIHADGITGVGQIRSISPGHFLPDTPQSMVAAITEVFGPLMIGRELTEIETINEVLTSRLAGNSAARSAWMRAVSACSRVRSARSRTVRSWLCAASATSACAPVQRM